MKIWRAIGIFVAVVLFCLGMGGYSLHSSMQNVISNQFIDSTIDELINTSITSGKDVILANLPDEITSQIPEEVIEQLPEKAQAGLETAKKEIAKDPQIQELSQKYMDAMISGITDENAVMPDVNKDIEEIVETNFPKVAAAVDTHVTQEQVSELAKEVSQKVDAQGLLEKGMSTIKSTITPQQQKMISALGFVQSSTCRMLSFASMGMAIMLVAIMKKSFYAWMSAIGVTSLLGGGCIMVGAMIANMFIDKVLAKLPSIFSAAGDGIITSISESGMYFIGFGGLIIIAFFVVKFITSRVVYE